MVPDRPLGVCREDYSVSTQKAVPTRVFTHSDRDLTDSLKAPGAAMDNSTERPPASAKIALIRSIAGYAEGHEDRALAEIAAVLNGADASDLLRARLAVES
jgi:hypothetical protein